MHGHSDHARAGHGGVMATGETLRIMAARYGEGFAASTQAAPLGNRQDRRCDGAIYTRRPCPGLGPDRHRGRRNAHRGLGRLQASTCLPYELIPCDVFITEATFGLPVFRHPDSRGEVRKLLQSVALFPERTHIVGAYALGKAQRLMASPPGGGATMRRSTCTAMERRSLQERGHLGETRRWPRPSAVGGAIVICPPSSIQDLWSRRFADPVTCFASGWMRVRARQKGDRTPAHHFRPFRLGRSLPDRHRDGRGRCG